MPYPLLNNFYYLVKIKWLHWVFKALWNLCPGGAHPLSLPHPHLHTHTHPTFWALLSLLQTTQCPQTYPILSHLQILSMVEHSIGSSFSRVIYACWISSFKALIKCSFLYPHPKQPLTLLSPCTASFSLYFVSHDLNGIKVTCAHGCISHLRDEAVTLIFSFFLLVARSSVWFMMSAHTLVEKLCIQQL